ncbi:MULTISPECIES: DUF3619 family protein [unclassified Undibacterium]|uniref:DUF3619 family protein n=1 Tax=unclassified Undibacterium TaxID=2630295 RepID=UPI002AC8E66F|nr:MULTISPECIES: DUF3619 family protein [unclassified Undibacterium]MEB0140046.1 DUF3619 family protein [Undibacterium sp. CCC2.1]MEB0173041.1 DUF3619 family protein [Undibacterium sp. CCC1.1]MEB0176853.1 DUF3619 family protein [Undibacterium sp. CCC3.4]MEB0216085.1 DUF3619 family protein [Undibacterium sp. 5I2]WPX42031.1 DUF3619 family protein [Undibacterium sp. CCC3.4]
MNYSQQAQDLDFAYKIKRALNESSETLPAATLQRLAQSRQLALSRKKAAPSRVLAWRGVLAGGANLSFSGPASWLGRLGLIIPLLVLIVGLMGIYENEKQQGISELADIDVAVLADELPPAAYIDTGFSAYLNKTGE